MSNAGRIKVAIRFRPRNHVEIEQGAKESPIIIDGNVISINNQVKHHFNYDIVFPQDIKQDGIFDAIGKEIIDNVINGFNSTLFAYGQTGSGKTYTLIGSIFGDDTSNRGLYPRCSDYLFECLMSRDDIKEAEVKMSAVEIYQEKIRDLLNEGKSCQIRSNRSGTYLQGASTDNVSCWAEIQTLMMIAMSQRQTGSTRMNQHSSRSHCILTLNVTQTMESGHVKKCNLSICDLAGSERAKKTQATGKRFDEGCQINKSLSALGQVIADLAVKKKFVNFRNSKLTFLLKDSLQGNTKTVLMATATLDPFNLSETLSTLRFASRAITIVNKVSKQIQLGPEQMRKLIAKLKGVLVDSCKLMLQMEGKKGVSQFEGGIQTCLSNARDVLADEFPGDMGDADLTDLIAKGGAILDGDTGCAAESSTEDTRSDDDERPSLSHGLHSLHFNNEQTTDNPRQGKQSETNDEDVGKLLKKNENYKTIIDQSRSHWENLRTEFREQQQKDADKIKELKQEIRRLSDSKEDRLLLPGNSRSSLSPQEEKYRKIMDDNASLIHRLNQAKQCRIKRSKMKRNIKQRQRTPRSSISSSHTGRQSQSKIRSELIRFSRTQSRSAPNAARLSTRPSRYDSVPAVLEENGEDTPQSGSSFSTPEDNELEMTAILENGSSIQNVEFPFA